MAKVLTLALRFHTCMHTYTHGGTTETLMSPVPTALSVCVNPGFKLPPCLCGSKLLNPLQLSKVQDQILTFEINQRKKPCQVNRWQVCVFWEILLPAAWSRSAKAAAAGGDTAGLCNVQTPPAPPSPNN